MIPIAPLATDDRPLSERVKFALRHPMEWLAEICGGGPAFALVVLFGLSLMEVMDRFSFSLLTPNIRDAFGMTDTGILTLVGLAALAGLALTVPIAQLSDRMNRVHLMAIGASLLALFTFGTGLATTILMLWIVRTCTGIGQATVFPTHNSLLADWFPIGARPRVYSFHGAALAVGAVLGPLIAGALSYYFSWRVPFFVLAVPTAVLVFLALKLKEPIRGIHEREAMGLEGDALITEEPSPSFSESWRMVWKIDSLRRIFYALPFLSASFIGFASLAAIFYQKEFGLDALHRSWIAATTEPVQLVGLYFGAKFGTRLIARDPSLLIRFLSVVALFTAAAATVFALAPWLWLTIVANMAISSMLAIIAPGVFAGLSLGIPPRARSMGFSLGAIWIIPGLIILPIVGAISDGIGVRAGMVIMGPIFLIGGWIISSAGNVLDGDIRQVWTMAAARSEVLYERRQGRVKLLLCRGLQVFYGNVQVLFDVDFEIDEGEIVALLGTNGAGKSTLLKAICGIVEADKGAVIFDGRDITHAPPNQIAALGVTEVPGGQGVFPSLSVAENLRVAGWLDRRNAAELKERTDQVLEQFPVLKNRLGEPAANLSGGQQQMLALSMAFLARPRMLLIDELSLGLAPVVVEQLLPMVRSISENGTTVILVEQSVNLALTVAKTAYFMEKGEIRFHGLTSELMERPDLLRSVFLEGIGSGGAPSTTTAPLTANGATGKGATGNGATTNGAPANGATTTNGAPVTNGAPANGATATNGADAAPGADATSAAPVGTSVPLTNAAAGDGAPVVPALAISGLSVRFGGIQAVDSVSLEVAPCEVVGIIGPNGAGKTTLFDLISGFTRADAGEVELAGRVLSSARPDVRARAGLGRSFQDARLFPAMTVEETIAVSLDRWTDIKDPLNAALHLPPAYDSEQAVARRVDELIDLLHLEAFRSKFVHELSTGSRRVVDIACVVAHHPSVVLLDEPSSGIAQREAEALGPLLLRLRDELGAALVIIEHDMPLVTSIADRLIALDQGQLISEGTCDEVLHDPVVVSSYLGDTSAVIARSGAASE